MAEYEQILRKLLDKVAAEQNYDNYELKIKQFSSGGANYTSLLYLVTITAPDKKDIEIFAKVACINETTRQHIPAQRYYDIERYFYTDLLRKYEQIENNHDVPLEHRLVTPKFYGCNEKVLEETVVLENLMARGFTTYDRFKSIDWDYAAKSVEELAKWHALSIAYGEENPEDYKELLVKMKFALAEPGMAEHMIGMWQAMTPAVLNATNDENKDKMTKFMTEMLTPEFLTQFYKPSKCPVLAHGDFRASNLMHKVNEDGTLDVIIVDYQTIQAGCPILDLYYLIFNCSDEEFRQQHFQNLIEHYYKHLCLALKRLNVDSEKVYPRKDFDDELKEMLPYGLGISVFLLQMVTVDTENAPEMNDELSGLITNPSKLFAERLNGVINDYVRWGII